MWPDTGLRNMLAMGAKPMGHQDATYISRDEESTAKMTSYMQRLVAKAPPQGEQLQRVWDLSEAEIKGGLLKGWYAYDEMDIKYGNGHLRELHRFAIKQGEEWRLIDNGRQASTTRRMHG